MDTTKLRKFAQFARRALIEQVGTKLESVREEGASARRERPEAFKQLQAAIAKHGESQIIERVAYIWFNRFSALRFLDVNELNPVRVVSPLPGQFQPEILADAKAGNINDQLVPEKIRSQVRNLLDGLAPSPDPQAEAYRLLLVAVCNYWQRTMPFLFERIDDYTELLLPADLQSNASILAYMREAMTPDVCEDVEVIGWLYQFYISEKKDQVFSGLKKSQKITAENIPAATQLFTPHWIVRYLVENSLGRLWLLNRPQSKLAAQMQYYIAPEQAETDFLHIVRPEDIRVCDPACGSGHILTYAFDLLHAIYEEEGYEADKIPALILTHNLNGIEIDDRAGALAAFALVMKAAAKLGRRRFLRLEVQPNICVMQNVRFTPAEMQDVATVVGRDLFTSALQTTLEQFEQAKNFGSLIEPALCDPAEMARVVRLKDFGGDLLLRDVLERLLKVLEMAEALSPKYHVVAANPPYMNAKGMNAALKAWTAEEYPSSKADFMTMFMERAAKLVCNDGYWSMINIPTWMFLDSFSDLRKDLIETQDLQTLVHLGRGIFGSDFGTVAFTTKNRASQGGEAVFRRLFDRHVDVRSQAEIELLFLQSDYNRYHLSPENFLKIPGAPFAYWANENVFSAFENYPSVRSVARAFRGISTGDNERFSRFWYEVSSQNLKTDSCSREDAFSSGRRWFPYNRGGSFRKWFGLGAEVIDYESGGRNMILANERGETPGFRHDGSQGYFLKTITWGALTAGTTSFRRLPMGYVLGHKGPGIVADGSIDDVILQFLNSRAAESLLGFVSPTLDTNISHLLGLPFREVRTTVKESLFIELSKSDWDAYETSWDFTTLPLLSRDHAAETLEATYKRLRTRWQGMTCEMKRLEEENNRIFIDAYGLQGELTPEVPLEEITLTCNPAYRYGGKTTEAELEARLLSDTMAEFLHYAVGCMFGRYSLDQPGLILANQGEGLADYVAHVPESSFHVSADNVIPVLDGEWFADDITDRFRKFLRVAFGAAMFQKNLSFIEAALGKDIRKWFTRDFFEYHVRCYKKRPFYWMFSSPKGSFNALIYMHRYRPDTVSVVLNDYLREFISKLQAERARLEKLADDPIASQSQRTKALKDVGAVIKQIAELEEWEREVVFPLAQEKIEIDLDDGVKQNYPLFGAALKPIKGLETADE